jgi:hypothetical protein
MMNFAPKLLAASGKSTPLCGLRAERGALRLLVLLLVGLPGCTRTTPGFCTTDDDCTRAQYCALPAAQCTDAIVLRAILSGDQVVPPTASQATGDFMMVVSEARNSARFTLNLALPPPSTLLPTSRAEILAGAVGQPNQSSLPLAAIGLTSLPSTGDLQLTADFLTGLRAGQYHIRITTSAFPTSGELRGQIFSLHPEDAGTGGVRLTGILSGQQETPANPSPGVGMATADFIESSGQLTVRYKLAGLTAGINGMHVHRGGFNVNGDQIYFLPTPAPMDFADTFSVGPEKLSPTMARLSGVLIKSGVSYLNIHSANYAAGELRAQLLPTAALPFIVALNPVTSATPTGSSGELDFYLSADTTKLAFRLSHTVTGVKGVMLTRPGGATPVTIACSALTSSAGQSGAQGYCDVDAATKVAGTTPALTLGDLTLGVLTATITSQANPAGELSGPVKLPKSM